MDPPQGSDFADRTAADRQHPGDPYRRRHRGRVRHHLRELRALRLPLARHRLRRARPCRARDTRGRAAARAGARRTWHRRRVRDADAGLVRQAGFLGALRLHRDRHRGGVRPRAHPHVALACDHHHRARRAVVAGGDGHAGPAVAARVQRDGGICARRNAGRGGLPVRPGRRGRQGRADLVDFARRLSVRGDADGRLLSPHRSGDDRVCDHDRRDHPDRLAHRRCGRRAAGGRRVRRTRVPVMGRARQSGVAGRSPAVRCRASVRRRLRARCRCI